MKNYNIVHTAKQFQYSYHLKNSKKKNWFDVNETDWKKDMFLNALSNISVTRIYHSRKTIIQKQAHKNGLSLRIALPKKIEDRYVGKFNDNTNCLFLLIHRKREKVLELFVRQSAKGDVVNFLDEMESGNFEAEILEFRKSYQDENGEINKERNITKNVR